MDMCRISRLQLSRFGKLVLAPIKMCFCNFKSKKEMRSRLHYFFSIALGGFKGANKLMSFGSFKCFVYPLHPEHEKQAYQNTIAIKKVKHYNSKV